MRLTQINALFKHKFEYIKNQYNKWPFILKYNIIKVNNKYKEYTLMSIWRI